MIGIVGGGAFGTALAIALGSDGHPVTLWARRPGDMETERENHNRLPGARFPDTLRVTGDMADLEGADTLLLSVPMQQMAGVLDTHRGVLSTKTLVACCKGVDLERLSGPASIIRALCPGATPAILTGPSFAADIARGLPTALTLAIAGTRAKSVQAQLSTSSLRLYLTDDLTGAELGGALKNVIAIACGAVIGAGLGESARAAVMTRGFAEMVRLAATLGARPETLTGLSGFGDLALTCTSPQSRNYRTGVALGRGEPLDPTITVEGMATARAVTQIARDRGLDLPLTTLVADLVQGETSVATAMAALMTRPLTDEHRTG